jgi:hypothetical protein
MRRGAATTDCEPALWAPFSNSVTTTLAIYDEALRHGDLLLHVPARLQDSGRIAALLQRHHVHDVGHFGPGTFEQFPIPDTG